MDKERALRRVKALLSKTEENGASIEEAKSAMSKANELMKQYMISIKDVNDIKETDVITRAVDRISIKEDVTDLIGYISKLMEVEHFYSRKSVTFIGFEADVEMAIYLYGKIMNGLIADIERFKKTSEYHYEKNFFHPNTIRRDFISGWVNEIRIESFRLFNERRKHDLHGLIFVKEKAIKEEFEKHNVRVVGPSKKTYHSQLSIEVGSRMGSEFKLNDDLKGN